MRAIEILNVVTSSLAAGLFGILIKIVIWAVRADQTIKRHSERFDGTGTRKGVFTRLDDIERRIGTESEKLRETGTKGRESMRAEMAEKFDVTDTLIDGVKNQVDDVRARVRDIRTELEVRRVIGPGADNGRKS